MDMKRRTRLIFAAVAALAFAGCATADPPGEASAASQTEGAREAAYQQCLRDRMAVAVAWEMIEEACRREAGADPDPLGARVE